MPCYHPIKAWRAKDGYDPKTGKWRLTFSRQSAYVDMPVEIPCGKCIGCRLERSREWAVRCVHEAVCHKKNAFITLTFNDESLQKISPERSLEKREFQLFMKRLRKWIVDNYSHSCVDSNENDKIRFFHCGEYGSKLKRPHHHAIIFGFDFPDKKFFRMQHGFPYYTSELLSELWPYGYNIIGNVTFESCAYVARYICKKINGDMAEEYYGNLLPEYVTMSRRPGLGANWYSRYRSDLYTTDKVIIRNGVISKIPRYYDKLYEKDNPEDFYRIKAQRRLKAEMSTSTYEDLQMQEKVKELKLEKLVRPFEAQKLRKVSGVEMKLRLYSIFDEKAKAFGSPFYMQTDGMALRLFSDQVSDHSRPSMLADHPEDFRLYRIGEFEDESGEVVSENQPYFLANGIDFVTEEKK